MYVSKIHQSKRLSSYEHFCLPENVISNGEGTPRMWEFGFTKQSNDSLCRRVLWLWESISGMVSTPGASSYALITLHTSTTPARSAVPGGQVRPQIPAHPWFTRGSNSTSHQPCFEKAWRCPWVSWLASDIEMSPSCFLNDVSFKNSFFL